jgi:hypothetical protein
VAANIALARQQTWKQIVTYKSTYCIGFCANCLVVFIVLLLSSAIAQFPVIYLRVAELRAGELDIVRNRTDNPKKEKNNNTNLFFHQILSSSVLEVPTLNYTQFASRLASTERLSIFLSHATSMVFGRAFRRFFVQTVR